MDIYLFGLNYKTAPLELRERLTFSTEESEEVLSNIASRGILDEAYILSTCNRTEFYGVSANRVMEKERFYQIFASIKPVNFNQVDPHSYFYSLNRSAENLLRVAAGLESMALGENQILAQVKEAYSTACKVRASGVVLNKLLHIAFRTGKRVRTETALGEGAVSISYAAVELARKIFSDLSNQTALLIGAGETGELTALHLKDKGVTGLFITNRTYSRAKKLSEKFDADPVPFEKLEETLKNVDIVISSTGSPEFLLTCQQVKDLNQARGEKPLFIIDIAVPRDFDPEINRLDNVFLYNIDDLEQIVNLNLQKRRAEIPRAEEIIRKELDSFTRWKETLRISPTIISLREKFESIRRKEVEKNIKKISPEERERVEMLTKSIVNKILHYPTSKLKEYNEDSRFGMIRIDTLRQIFNLNIEEDEE